MRLPYLLPMLMIGLTSMASAATTYYVDDSTGSDANPGTRMSTPIKSLEKANSIKLGPGDKLLFKAGSRYTGQLKPTGRGAKGRPILIGMYGRGDKPRFDGEGKVLDTVLIENMEYVTIENLEITNKGEKRREWQTGFKLSARNCGTLHDITVRDLHIHDVNGSLKKSKEGCGLFIQTSGETKSRFDGLLVEKCRVISTDRNAICMRGGFCGRSTNWFPSLNVVIRHNVIEDCGGDGIKPWGCDGALVEHNVIRGARMRCTDLAAGIWPWSCDNTVIQFNEVSGCKGTGDGQGFDCDYNCRNTLIQYNYSHDNDGGFLLVCSPRHNDYRCGSTNSIIRYNVSYNDAQKSGARIFHISGAGVKDTYIYNNVIYVKKRAGENQMVLVGMWGGAPPENTVFQNNIFFVEGTVSYKLGKEADEFKFDGNCYVGNHKELPKDAHAINADPKFTKLLDGKVEGFEVLKSLMLRAGSPCIGAAKAIPNNGGRDFFGNRVRSDGPTSIGVHEAPAYR